MHSRRTALFHCFRSLCRLPSVSSQTFRKDVNAFPASQKMHLQIMLIRSRENMNGRYRSKSNLIYVSNVTPMLSLTSRKCICCLRRSLTFFCRQFFRQLFRQLFFRPHTFSPTFSPGFSSI